MGPLIDCQGYVYMARKPGSLFSSYLTQMEKKKTYIPKKIIYNGPATIVFWDDGTKTVVKRSQKDKDNKYNAFCAALAKKIYGSNSKVNSIVAEGKEE